MRGLYWLDPYDDGQAFPNPEQALSEPDGLLAAGGSLSPRRLLRAYRHGIFPWYTPGQPILWWSPDPRTVLFPERLKISRSLRKTLRKAPYRLSMDTAFAGVVQRCSEPRRGQPGTWITAEMSRAYGKLHQLGYAHSVEAWQQEELVGGLYGVAIGRVFYGESMFSRRDDASKVALAGLTAQLQRWDFAVIDCQMPTPHLISLGAEEIPRRAFIALLKHFCPLPGYYGQWQFDAWPEPSAPS
jgi:leucyl/phenylalanyl-tRNA--protein transferase